MAYISNIKYNNEFISFDLNNKSNDIKIGLANSIRRTILSDIYCYVIDKNSVNFFNNTSLFDNEFLIHRLTLIPIISNLNYDYNNILITCNKSNNNENTENIYVSDFICKDKESNTITENNILFKYTNILFAKIKTNQNLSFECKLIKNNAENGGAFFNVVGTCIYTFKIDDKAVKNKIKNLNDSEINIFKREEIERTYEKNKFDEPNCYQFSIESIGFFELNEIINLGLDALINKLKITQNEFNDLNNSEKITLHDIDNKDFFSFYIDNENETLGNLLASYINDYSNILFCGYIIEHPLKKNILLKIKLDKNNNIEEVVKIININIDIILNILENIKKEFK